MKKLLAIFLSVLLICAAVPFAFATAAEEPTIALPDLEAKAGDTIEVPIMLNNNPGIVSAWVEIEYDSSVLELVTYYNEDEGADMNLIVPGEGYTEKWFSWGDLGDCIVNFCHGTSKSKDYTGAVLATATFKVKDDAAAGTYPLTVNYDPAAFFNCADKGAQTVAFGAVNGSVTIAGDEPIIPDEPVYTKPTIVLSTLTGKAGDTVDVEIMLKNNPGIVSAWVEVVYDSSVLELVTYYNEDEGADMNLIVPGEGYTEKWFSWGDLGDCIVNFCHGTSKSKDYTGELLATATFKIKDDAAAGTYPLVVNYDPAAFFNCADKGAETIVFEAADGAITVEGDAPVGCKHEYDAACDPDCNLCGEIRPVHTEGIIHFDAVEPGCHYNGNIEYWFCPECECFWADEALTQLTNSKNVIVPAKGGEVIAFEAIEPACHYNGQIAYWFCPECEQYWQDEALTQLTNSKNVILPATGSENLQHVEAKDATCNEEGNIEYWYCPDCEQYWQDEALTQLTNSKNVVIGVTEHNIVHMEAVAPGCHYIGNIEYWFCTICEIHWQDEALTQLTNSKNVILPAVGGEVIAFEAIEPACHYNGQIAYWFCPECEQYWQDEALTQITNSKNVILPATGSDKLQHVEAKDPTCNELGNIEYWFCGECEQYWQDEALTQLTNSKNVLIDVTDHNIVHIEAVAPGCHYLGNIEYWYCTNCELFWADEALTQLTNSKNVIIPALGGDVIAFEAIEPACHYNGQIAYWFCPECQQYWQDEALTQLTNSKNVILPATGSDKLQHVEAKDPTCNELGNIEYWFCGECEQYWQDEALTQITNSKNVLIDVVDHNIVHIEAVAPGCHYLGNIEYWYCTNCELFWADEALTQLTNSKNVILPATGSDKLQHVEAKEPTATENGNVEYWFCPECEQFWTDEALTQLTNSKNVIIPATGETEEPDSPVTGESSVAVVVALLTLVASGVAVVLLKDKKRA